MAGPTAGRPLDLTHFDPDRLYRRIAVDPDSGCWLWMGALNENGYGRIGVSTNRGAYTHRVAYTLFVGPIPAGMTIDHLCRTRSCANPDHLEVVSQGVNVRRSPRANMPTCPKGHIKVERERTARGQRQVWRYCPTCQEYANQVRSQAFHLLGLSQRQYIRQYGGSVAAAEQVLAAHGWAVAS